jgi:hypothetical protein
MTDETPKKLILNPDLEGICPCGKKFFLDSKQLAVIHEMPMCEKFRVLEIVPYLRYVRQALTGITDN